MGWTLTDDLEEFLARAGGFLRGDPVANTVALTVTENLHIQGADLYGAALFGWWTNAGRIDGTFLRTGSYPPLLSAMPEQAARDLARVLARHGDPVPGVNGEPATARAFAETWTNKTTTNEINPPSTDGTLASAERDAPAESGAAAEKATGDGRGAATENGPGGEGGGGWGTGGAGRVKERQRLYRLGRLEVPDPLPEGAARVAGAADGALVLDWFAAFGREAGDYGDTNRAAIEAKLGDGRVTLWEAGGRPVAVAGRTPTVAGMARVAPVYTPPEHRRRGYAAAVTAAVTRAALDGGATEVVLFTDLANPTSNGVYQRLGYRTVQDRVVLDLT
ncbi:GNAT family N-acetyltransferase [Spirillospora sp. NBC_00431]